MEKIGYVYETMCFDYDFGGYYQKVIYRSKDGQLFYRLEDHNGIVVDNTEEFFPYDGEFFRNEN